MRIHRVDAGVAMSAESIIGRAVRILWPEDDAWFSGTIESYDSTSGQHTVGQLLFCWPASSGCNALSLTQGSCVTAPCMSLRPSRHCEMAELSYSLMLSSACRCCMQMATLRAFCCRWSASAWTSTRDAPLRRPLQRSSPFQRNICCAQLMRLTVLGPRKVGTPGILSIVGCDSTGALAALQRAIHLWLEAHQIASCDWTSSSTH